MRARKTAAEAALRLLAQRMRGRRELERRLLDAGYPPDEAAEALKMLAAEGYLDDADFARAFIMDKMNLHGHGERRIRRELGALGVARADIDSGFALCEARFEEEGEPRLLRELQNALRAAEKCLRGQELNAATARRAADNLARRGFDFAVVREALRLYKQNTGTESEP